MTTYRKHLSEPWFSLVKLGLKTVEGRLDKGDFKIMQAGDIVIFENNDFGRARELRTTIQRTTRYQTFEEYLEKETIKQCLPSIDGMDDALSVYQKYFENLKEDEVKYGVVCIAISQ
jgi:ASC-1-like (ASCH) protein